MDPDRTGLNTLWDIDDQLVACLDALEQQELDGFTPRSCSDFFGRHGCGDLLVRWTDKQIKTSAAEGKVPKLESWRAPVAKGKVGLDALMNLAGWNSFDADQREMDAHVRAVLG